MRHGRLIFSCDDIVGTQHGRFSVKGDSPVVQGAVSVVPGCQMAGQIAVPSSGLERV